MTTPSEPSTGMDANHASGLTAFVRRWHRDWEHSLRFRLLTLGLLPLLLAFPIIILVLAIVGGGGLNNLLESNLRGSLAGAKNYLDQQKSEAGVRVGQLVHSDRLIQLLSEQSSPEEIKRVLATTAKGSGLDYLIVATPDGTILGSSTPTRPGSRLPDSHVMRQAGIGLVSVAYERATQEQLGAFSPDFPLQALPDLSSAVAAETGRPPTYGLLINAGAHFPLGVRQTDAVLIGGILLNKNYSLVEHMRAVIFPVGMLPGDAEGMTAIYSDRYSVAVSRLRQQGQRFIGAGAPDGVAAGVLERGEPWLGSVDVGDQSHMVGYEAIVDGEGRRIGMIAAGFPDGPYRRGALLVLALTATLLAMTMLGLSIVFLQASRDLTQRLKYLGETMIRVRQGERQVRVGAPEREDELGQLARHFDVLLDTIAMQDDRQRAAQQVIADEALRRRALFEHERDGVIILNPDGTVFEANPKAAEMLGYSLDELQHTDVNQWETRLADQATAARIPFLGADGQLFETRMRRKDGKTFAAEVAASKAQWADRTFVLILIRNISQRKAVESELERYRIGLERLVEERTGELKERSEQLDSIFALSPDGFVSFDTERRVAFANLAFQRMTGLDIQKIQGLSEAVFSDQLARLCLPQARFPGVSALRTARLNAQEDTGREPYSRRQLIELSGPGALVLEVGIRTAEGERVSQILYFRDVTHEMEVDRMKSEFLSTAAHELRTPMASIYGYSEVLLSEQFEPEIQAEMLQTIFRQSALMSSIINELLDLARIEARRGKDFVLERVPVSDIVDEAVARFKPPPQRQAPVVTLQAQGLFVHADRNKMQQAMLNVLSNAYKYSPGGGDVGVTVQWLQTDSFQGVNIEIRDTGIGMTPGQLARVCERFYRADTSGSIPGTGLGMSIVKEIVELHGGQVHLESTPGKGTSVHLRMPTA